MKKIYLTAYLLVVSITAFTQISKKDSIKKDTIRSIATVGVHQKVWGKIFLK